MTNTTQKPQETLEQRQQRVEALSADIINIVESESGTALRGIHMLNVAGTATRGAYKALERRVMEDNDPYGAYHLALIAQSTPNLPFDVRRLIDMVLEHGDNDQLFSLLKNLPLPPVEIIQAKINASEDKQAIERMNTYLADNPEGYGSEIAMSSGQKDRIIPLNEEQ